MAAIENVTASRLSSCVLEGKTVVQEVRNLVRTVTIHESICSPYITAEIILLDNSNVITNLQVEGGNLCHVNFDVFSESGRKYDIDLYVLDIKGIPHPDIMDMKIYTISFCTSEYFTDRGNTTSKSSDLGQTGCQLAQTIWKECKFKVPLIQPTQDSPLRDGKEPFHVDLVKPFTAIGQIRDIQNYPSYPTGNVLHYRDALTCQHVPLQYIYENCKKDEEFIQKQTWGTSYSHMFGGDKSFHSIIDIKECSRATMLDPDEFKIQKKRATDQVAGKMGLNMFSGLIGGGANFALRNSDRTSPEIDATNNMDAARYYALCLKSQPQYLVKVPLQTGINITVGLGAYLDLLPVSISQPHPDTGLYLVTDLFHECHNDLRIVNGTTTFQALKTGADCVI